MVDKNKQALKLACSVVAFFAVLPLLLSSLNHFSNPYLFLQNILEYEILSFSFATVASAVLPGIQIVLAIACLVEARSVLPLVATSILYFVFAEVQASALARDLPISCGCFGAESGQVSVLTVLEVFALGLVCATIAVVRSRVIHHFEESEKL